MKSRIFKCTIEDNQIIYIDLNHVQAVMPLKDGCMIFLTGNVSRIVQEAASIMVDAWKLWEI